ncbi:MBL fold metallo-hydrolase [Kitasatospora viridis]|uniref:Glyoxylase-like metal-dependent hydrolase (Beta-lactamase superfamily II) n=1 Tax=Kitasatospora viridis TaxID=281105 RepID=A0A561TW39_9ACTN|nr:MBL fold metallo-hydrolase [Kitasatospora viridis]TWF91328.1 glyoxylase-like metal-dependent hydrolase (beta-lactamase superfamily II) [Kitasatospora viridis]
MNTMTHPQAATPASTGWHLGGITVRRVDEIELPRQTGPWLLPGATKEVLDEASWLRPDFADAEVPRLASHSFAVTAGGLRIVVDTGIGNGKERANPAWNGLDTDFLEQLTAAGFPPESVDLVITTHLHTDHVGWNTRLADGAWVPTFPRARYLTSRTEWDHWAGTELDEARAQMFRDSVHPVRDAGQYDLVDVPDQGYEVAPGIVLVPAPGHTPGQVAVELRGGDRRALITGDSIHHPVQLSHPHVHSCVDIDSAQAIRTRARLLDAVADTDALLMGTHFPRPTAGTVRREGDRYRLLAEPGVQLPS